MEPNTALFTFMLETTPNVNSVHLVGSWDNFAKRYPMERDSRRGRGHWKGCHAFENIICDGELGVRGRKRDGGLKMGGKYWYYFELDGDVEIHNPMEPSTNSCPFLPGQPINILDVPIEAESEHHRSQSWSSGSGQLTLNPADKYTQPRPAPKPRPRISTSPASLSRRSASPWGARSGHSSPTSVSSTSSRTRHLPFSRKRSVTDSGGLKSPNRNNSLRATFFNARDSDSEGERDSGGSDIREMKISNPVLISRSDEGRHCIPISVLSRTPSPTSPVGALTRVAHSGNPSDTRPPTSPLRFHPVLPSGEASPVRVTPREPSPLRNPALDVPLPPLPVEIIVEEDENVDFNLDLRKSQESGFIAPTILKPPPPRKRLFKDATFSTSPECPSPSSPGTTSVRQAALRPEPLHLREKYPTMDQEPQSRFSVYSNSTAAYSPNTINSPASACFSSTNGDSSVPDSPYELPTPYGSEFAVEDSTDMRDESRPPPVDDKDQDYSFGGLRINTGDSKRKAACFGFPAFQGYSLPVEENSSQATLRKTATLQDASRATFGP
ncbi:hypothetical protein GP486_008302, partial [Trichoglossum hirsutum]